LGHIKIKDRIIRINSSGDFQAPVKRAAKILFSGGIIAYPTETFYGLAVDSTNEKAIKRLFLVKKRTPALPILILIPSVNVLCRYVRRIPEIGNKLINKFWPGGLTIIFEADQKVSPLLTAGSGKIGVRLSNHPVATALTREIGVPVTGTSANISGAPPCRSGLEVFISFKKGVDLILDGGKTKESPGSTIIDITVSPPQILREGMIDKNRLMEFIAT